MTCLNNSIEIIDLSDDNDTTSNQEMEINEDNTEKLEVKQKSDSDDKNDYYCWICHEDGDLMVLCDSCSRSYHVECSQNIDKEHDEKEPWECDECKLVREARQERKLLNKVSREQFDAMLKHVLKRICYQGTEAFQKPVDINDFPEYYAYVVTPMDFSIIENKIHTSKYESLEEFMSDIKYLVHNSSVYNGPEDNLTKTALSIFRMARHDIKEIEVCPDCFLSSMKNNEKFFCEPCRIPHPLIWAKMKGYPYWPAKALRVVDNEIDARFFGKHDRARIPISNCFWLSENSPSQNQKKFGYQESLRELNEHIEIIKEKYGQFVYADEKSICDPSNPHKFIPVITENTLKITIIRSSKKRPNRSMSNQGSSDDDINKKRGRQVKSLSNGAQRDPSVDTTLSRGSSDAISTTTIIPNFNTTPTKVTSLDTSHRKSQEQTISQPSAQKLQIISDENPIDKLTLLLKRCKEAIHLEETSQVNSIKMEKRNETEIKYYQDKLKQIEQEKNSEIKKLKLHYEKLLKETLETCDAKCKETLNQSNRDKIHLKKEYENLILQKVIETKNKAWCCNCLQEASYYCCWNTNYCSEECQKAHWDTHMDTCQNSSVNQ